jgi:hypothetical protein
MITITSANQLVDPGTGSFMMQFMPSATNDTLVLHPGGVDQIFGFNMTDLIDARALSGSLAVVAQGADALVNIGGGTVAILNGLGSELNTVLSHILT